MELFVFGGCRYLLMKIISKVCEEYCKKTLYKNDPELVYYDLKSNDSLYNKIIKNILLYLMYCIPNFSNILFGIHAGGCITNCISVKCNTSEIANKVKTKFISPITKKARFDHNRNFYNTKSMIDSLILDGADIETIDRVVSDAKKEIGFDYENPTLYRKTKNNVGNMKKLKRYTGVVADPVKLYKDTKDNEVREVFISDEDLERLVVKMNLMESRDDFSKVKIYGLKK